MEVKEGAWRERKFTAWKRTISAILHYRCERLAAVYRSNRSSRPPPHHLFGLKAFARGVPPGVDRLPQKRKTDIWISPWGGVILASPSLPPERWGCSSFGSNSWRREALKA